MTVDPTTPRTRRAVIAGAIGGTATLAALALGRPDVARAGDDGDVVLGEMNTSDSSTIVSNTSPDGVGLHGDADAATGASFGLSGSSNSPDGAGVYGTANAATGGVGVLGEGLADGGVGVLGAGETYGVWGAGAGTGVFGSTGSGTGVIGYSQPVPMGTAPQPSTPASTGVYGYAAQDGTASGVLGESTVGRGVHGGATTGTGVSGLATTGTAAYFKTSGLKNGTALRTVGRVRFDNSVGIATIGAGRASVTVTPGIDLLATSAVVATLQANPTGTIAVQGVVVNVTGNTFTIYLTATAASAMKVAWHVFG
jgi:hypothetical protein